MKKLLTVLLALLVLGGIVVSAGCISTTLPSDSITGTWGHNKTGSFVQNPIIYISNDLTGCIDETYSIPMTTTDDIGLSDELPGAAGKSIYLVEYGIKLFPSGDNTYLVGCDYYYVNTYDDCEYYYEPDDYVEFGTINLIGERIFIYDTDDAHFSYKKIPN